MCYWVGTKNVRKEMLQRKQQSPENDIAQLFYSTFECPQAKAFRQYFVAIGKSQPTLSVLYYENHPTFTEMSWGLPMLFKNTKSGDNISRIMINSRVEKAFSIHKNIIYHQRCVVPIDGYFEFFHFAGDVYPHFIYPQNGIFYVAGVFSKGKNDSKNYFSMLSCPPNTLTQKLHNNPKAPNGSRMLMILKENNIMHYLNPSATQKDIEGLFKPYPEELMSAYPVPRFLRKEFAPHLQTPKARERIDYPQLLLAE